MFVSSMLLAGLVAAPAPASEVGVWIKGPIGLVERVWAGLDREGTPVLRAPTAPELMLALEVIEGDVWLHVQDTERPRRIGRGADLEATARRVVIVVEEMAREHLDARNPAQPAPMPALSVELGPSVWWWSAPSTPLLGVELSAAYRIGSMELGLGAGWTGCCGWSAEGIDAEARQLRLGVQGALRLLRVHSLSFSAVGELGLLRAETTARANAFAGPTEPESRIDWYPYARLGLGAGLGLGRHFALRLRGGLRGAVGDLEIELPPSVRTDSSRNRRGQFGPWLGLGLRVYVP